MTDRKSTFFIITLLFVIVISVLATYYKYVVIEDFPIFTDEEIFYEELGVE